MDMSQLAAKMLEWEEITKRANALEAEIKAAVLEIGKSQTVGNVRASYSQGRRTFDYQTPAANADPEIVESYTVSQMVTQTDWPAICKAIGVEPLVSDQKPPSVSIKLL